MKIYGTDIEINTFDDNRLTSIAYLCNTHIESFHGRCFSFPYYIDVINGILSCMIAADMIPDCFMHYDGRIEVTVEN